MAGFGGAVKLTGEDAYRAALKKITQNLKEVSSEMKLVSSQYDKNDKSEAAVEAKTKALSAAYVEQQKKLSLMATEYRKLTSEYAEQTKKHDALVSSYNNEKKTLDEIEKELGQSSDEYKEQKKVVDELEKQVRESTAAQDANEKSLSQMRIEMNKAQTEVNKTARKIDELGKEEDDTTKDTKELGESIKESGNAAEKSEGGFTVMKGALASLVADGFRLAIDAAKKLTTAVINAGQAADELNTTSKQSGFSTEMLQKFNYAAELIDVDTETIISAARKMKKNMASETADTVEAFEKLGVSVRDSNGELRDSEAVFFEVVEGLSRISNETDRDTTAMKLFGKGADELAGIIDDGGEAFREYGKEAENLGLILGQDTLDAANDFNDSIDKIKSTAKGAFSAVGSEIAKELMPFVEKAQKKIQSLVKSEDFQDLKKKAVDAIGTVFKTIYNLFIFVKDNWRPIVTALSAIAAGLVAFKIASVISATVSAISGFITAIKTAESVTAAFTATAGVNPFVLIATGIAAAVAALAVFASSAESAEEKVERLAGKQSELVTAALETADSFREARDAAAERAEAQIADVDFVEKKLLPQLSDIVDANGKVKAGEEERAQYILGELNRALGTEYDDLNDIVEANGNIKDSIYEVISARKAQIYLDAYKDTFTQALKERETSYEKVADAASSLKDVEDGYNKWIAEERAKWTEVYGEENQALIEQQLEWQKSFSSTGKEFQAELERRAADYKGAVEAAGAYEETIQRYNAATTAVLEGNTDKAVELLGVYGTAFKTSVSVQGMAAEEQKRILGEQAVRLQSAYEIMVADHKRSWDSMTEEQRAAAKEQEAIALERANSAKKEFRNVGGVMVAELKNGVETGKYKFTNSMQLAVNEAVRTAENSANGAYNAGANLANSLTRGYESAIGSFYALLDTTSKREKAKIEQIWGIGSPSKYMRQIGKYIVQGEVLGVEDEQKHLNDALKGLGHDSQASLVSGMTSQTAMRSTAKQNEVGMVAAFKEALAEMKIELDDRVAGKFVERTVARAIY